MWFGKQETDEERKEAYKKRWAKVQERQEREAEIRGQKQEEKALYEAEHPHLTKFKQGFKETLNKGAKATIEYVKKQRQAPRQQTRSTKPAKPIDFWGGGDFGSSKNSLKGYALDYGKPKKGKKRGFDIW